MKKIIGRKRRHKILRKRIVGTEERPRLCIFRSNRNFSVQLIDDTKGHTIMSVSTLTADVKTEVGYGGNVKAAGFLGAEFAKRAKAKGVSKVVLDRAGHLYHGRVKAFAEAARKGGLVF